MLDLSEFTRAPAALSWKGLCRVGASHKVMQRQQTAPEPNVPNRRWQAAQAGGRESSQNPASLTRGPEKSKGCKTQPVASLHGREPADLEPACRHAVAVPHAPRHPKTPHQAPAACRRGPGACMAARSAAVQGATGQRRCNPSPHARANAAFLRPPAQPVATRSPGHFASTVRP